MGQQVIRMNLQNASFPLLTGLMGKSIVIPGADQTEKSKTQSNVADGNQYLASPQMMYVNNMLPTANGYKSVDQTPVLAATGRADFEYAFAITDEDENKCLVAFGADHTNLNCYAMKYGESGFSVSSYAWTAKLPNITSAYAGGKNYFCIPGYGVLVYSSGEFRFSPAAITYPSGVVATDIVAICSSNNYLIMATVDTVYWSSTINPEDFTPSLTTGAGSGIPNDLNGRIVSLNPLNNGFVVYTSDNIILSSFSNNTNFPWIFRNANNGAGITSSKHVTSGTDLSYHYAWTSSGMLKVTSMGCEAVFPEVTDFLTTYIYETVGAITSGITNYLIITPERIVKPLSVRVRFIGSRYLAIAYGKALTVSDIVQKYTQILVYDIAMKRWGKLSVDSVTDLIELNFDSTLGLSNSAAIPKDNFGLLLNTGEVRKIRFDTENSPVYYVASGILFGRIALTRTSVSTLLRVEAERQLYNGNVFGTLLPSNTGEFAGMRATIPLQNRHTNTSDTTALDYACRSTAKEHLLYLSGTMHLSSLVLTFAKHGRR